MELSSGEDRLRICSGCIGESYLSEEVAKIGQSSACSYCHSNGKTISIVELAGRVEKAFEQHYRMTSPHDPWDRGGLSTEEAIAGAADLDQEPAADISNVLAEKHFDFESMKLGDVCPYDEEARYVSREPDDFGYEVMWSDFEGTIMQESRFLTHEAANILASIFGDLNQHRGRDGCPAILEAGPRLKVQGFYRARVFQSDGSLTKALKRPDRHLGPPPHSLARAGRMNSHGIAVFYGATHPEAAISEVRPPVGSQTLIGYFKLLRPVRLLNIDALRSIETAGSIFDPSHIDDLIRAKFLGKLSNRLTRPVMPNDEKLEYVATQVIAEFLANLREPELDGVWYPSVQSQGAGANVVLFHKASKVRELDLPKRCKLDCNLGFNGEYGWERSYTVWEGAEAGVPKSDSTHHDFTPADIFLGLDMLSGIRDSRDPVLELDVDSLKVHVITCAKYKSEEHSVSRVQLHQPPPQSGTLGEQP